MDYWLLALSDRGGWAACMEEHHSWSSTAWTKQSSCTIGGVIGGNGGCTSGAQLPFPGLHTLLSMTSGDHYVPSVTSLGVWKRAGRGLRMHLLAHLSSSIIVLRWCHACAGANLGGTPFSARWCWETRSGRLRV